MYDNPEQQQVPLERPAPRSSEQRVEQHQSIARLLRGLPQEIRQPYDWTEFRRRARERTSAKARAAVSHRKYLATAAALVLVVVGIAAWVRLVRPGTVTSVESERLSRGEAQMLADSFDERAVVAERWLASLPNEPVVVRVGTRAAVAGLEDRIAQLDDLLSAARVEGTQPAKLAALEQQRVRLVSSLVQVRYAETLASEAR
jgi:hypothetical protein